MSRYDEVYNFRLACINDVESIMKFIGKEWREDHILSYDKELFVWQYGRTEYGDHTNINFVVMEDKEGNMVGGIGFIAYSNDPERLHISTAITITKAEGMLPLSGLELMRRQVSLVGEKMNFAHGTNPNTIMPLFEKVFHHKVGMMQQYYMINPNVSEYKVATINERKIIKPIEYSYMFSEIASLDETDFDFEQTFANLPFKSKQFINKRYFHHPIYKYKKWIITDEKNKTQGLLFGREIEICDRKILRIVDYRGPLDILYKCGKAFNSLLNDEKYEYIDIMVDNLSEDKMMECGFTRLDVEGDNIIPNYFEPFVRENIRDYYQKNADVVIFKGDGDQDRPNRR